MAEKNKGGRPSFELSDDDITKLVNMIRIQCTRDEVCGIFGVTDKTLNVALKNKGFLGFSALYKKNKASLWRSQWETAPDRLLLNNLSLLYKTRKAAQARLLLRKFSNKRKWS